MKRVFLNQNKQETKKGFHKPTRNSRFKLKREKIKKSLHKSTKQKSFLIKNRRNQRNFHDPIINRDEKIEEIKIFFMILEIIFLSKKKIIKSH